MLNRLALVKNPYQGTFKRVLCVCSAGLLRSPTAALVLSADPYQYNTRAVGISSEYALITVDWAHLVWADEVVTFEHEHSEHVRAIITAHGKLSRGPVIVELNIPDDYEYRDPQLIQLIKTQYDEALCPKNPNQ